ncbi:hypothetical protein [Roseovarius sp. CAU 1744]|uniref:hypothetical protein n=1 Tax=Roseovarius sp. CAU 1744 TaxID=3140368 RepID=UPI00325BF1DF
MSSGGGGGGGSAGGGGAAGGAGGNAGGPGGGGGGDSIFSDRKQDTVTRSRTPDEIVAPVGYVISDDVCTGGKYEKC